ncbi:hypothetical protein A9P98_10810 [Cylindrospermopsis raciborskii CS-505]|uniref:Uncharacterized protein n=1 Tax=Cylindrospermopsis raciborskii CS-505 TaxID=533240 RepID=A0A853MDY4_9CYAN|nr:hypothetical protein A9P98_10810 [Cylindrospermopsis raciborskii CS-505]
MALGDSNTVTIGQEVYVSGFPSKQDFTFRGVVGGGVWVGVFGFSPPGELLEVGVGTFPPVKTCRV